MHVGSPKKFSFLTGANMFEALGATIHPPGGGDGAEKRRGNWKHVFELPRLVFERATPKNTVFLLFFSKNESRFFQEEEKTPPFTPVISR